MKRFGVLGGTFDPIHLGHLIIGERVREACGMEEVLFVPAGTPPHKPDLPISHPEHRYRMTVLATSTNPKFRVHRVDLDREGPSYTVETMDRLKAELTKEHGEVELFFIMGADSLLELTTWHQPERLLSQHRVAVANRPGWRLESASEALGSLYTAFHQRIQTVEVPGLEISSRDLRARLRQGHSVRYVIPDPVLRYIEEHGLYQEDSSAP